MAVAFSRVYILHAVLLCWMTLLVSFVVVTFLNMHSTQCKQHTWARSSVLNSTYLL